MNLNKLKYLPFAVFSILLPVLFLLYYKSFTGPFYLDSLLHLSVDQSVFLTELFKDSDQTISKIGTRLLITLTFVLNEILGGHSPKSFRIGNVIIHWLTTLALYQFLKQLYLNFQTKEGVGSNKNQSAILLLTLLWALHPISTTAVTYVIQRAAALSTLFLFLTFAMYLRTRRLALENIQENEQPPLLWSIKWGFVILLSFMFAVASKETAILGLPMIIVMELFLQKGIKNFLKNRLILFLIISAAIPAFFAIYGHRHEIGMIFSNYHSLSTYTQFTWYERLLTESRVLVIYLYKIIFPWYTQFNLQRAVNPSTGLFAPFTTILSILFLCFLLFYAWNQKTRKPLLSIAILCFFISQLVESTILPLHIYFEHRVYFPSIFILIVIFELIPKTLDKKWFKIITPIILFFLGTQTYLRNSTYGNPIKLYSNDLKVSKTNLALCNLGNEYLTLKDYKNSLKYYSEAMVLSPSHYGGYAGAGSSYLHLNQPEKAEMLLKKSYELGGKRNIMIIFELGLSKLIMTINHKKNLTLAWQDFLVYANLNQTNKFENYLWVVAALVRYSKLFNQTDQYKIAHRNIQECIKHQQDIPAMKVLTFIFLAHQSKDDNFFFLEKLQALQTDLIKNHPTNSITHYLQHFNIKPQEQLLETSHQLEGLINILNSLNPGNLMQLKRQKVAIHHFLTKALFKSDIPKHDKLKTFYSIIEITQLIMYFTKLDQKTKFGLNTFAGRLIDASFSNAKTDKFKNPYFHMILGLAPIQVQKIVLKKN